MEATSRTRAFDARAGRLKLDPTIGGIWLLAFALPVFLALNGGGYDSVVRGQIGIAIWWAVLVGCVVGVVPRTRVTPIGWAMVACLGLFTLWSLLSTTWSSSSERSVLEAARVVTHLGVLVLAVLVVRRETARYMISAVAAAVGLIGVLALLSRLHPAWFPEPVTASLLPSTASRLSYPLNYWNALGAFMALGTPLLLGLAAGARTMATRGLAAAAVPLCAGTLYLTFSRGGVLALAVGLALLLFAWPRRLALLASIAACGVAAAVVVLSLHQRGALADASPGALAAQQGDQMIRIAALAAIGAGLLHVAIGLVDRHVDRPAWLKVSPRRLAAGFAVLVVVVAGVGVAAGGLGKLSDQWQSFKQRDTSIIGAQGNRAQRLTATSGNGRYQYWQAAADAAASNPLHGTGAGTFEYWWAQHATIGGFIRNAHSLWMETLGDLGFSGLALILAIFLLPFAAAIAACRRATDDQRRWIAAATAGFAAFTVSATFDWVWQVTVLPVAALLLGAVLVAGGDGSAAGRRIAWGPRLVGAILAVGAIILIALPLAGVVAVRESQAKAQEENISAAIDHAIAARQVQPYAATPLLQEALLREAEGDLAGAAIAATQATRAESQNWRTWFVLSRVEAERGHAQASVAAFRKARALNPKSNIFKKP